MTPNGALVLMLVDDDPAQLRLVSTLAQRAGWRTVTAAGSDMALARLSARDGSELDAVLVESDGDDVTPLIRAMRARRPDLPIVALTGNGSVDAAVAAMRAGASDFLVKPVAPARLLAALSAAVDAGVAGGELRPLAEKFRMPLAFEQIVGTATRFRSALTIAAKAAQARVPMLIEGEAGTGKDVIADAVHAASPRGDRPLVHVDCAGLPANGIEPMLFGHAMGAFPGAFAKVDGQLAAADGGTIVLDEVGKLSPEAQAKLLHLLDTGETLPLGAPPRTVDVRVIAVSTKPLIEEVEAGRLREDLYYRLSAVHACLPPLRERQGDIIPLAKHMLTRIATVPGLREIAISTEALDLLAGYDWPGNARQLYNALFRAAALSDDECLEPADFPQISGQAPVMPPGTIKRDAGDLALFDSEGHIRALDAIEADVIRYAVSHYRGRMTEVARRLGIGRSTLYRKLAELGISAAA